MGLGLPEILLILVVVLILFGAGKLPNVMGQLGKGVKSFREGAAHDDDEPVKYKDVTPPSAPDTNV